MVVIDHLGIEYNSVEEMLNKYGVKHTTFRARIRAGWSLEKALTTPVKEGKPCKDHLGKVYRSLSNMLKAYNIKYNTFVYRINSNWGLEKALTTPVKEGKPCKDHLGKEFTSIVSMCEYYNISIYNYVSRMNTGWSLEDALTKPVRNNLERIKPIDHLGNKYSSLNEMCSKYNIKPTTLKQRIDSGWSLERSLTTPLLRPKICKGIDHLGNRYNSTEEMCREYKISPVEFYNRLLLGWSLEKALTVPMNEIYVSKDAEYKCEDHLGNRFNSIDSMCRYWGVNLNTYTRRISQGMSLEDALRKAEKRKIDNSKKCKDHLGKEYDSMVGMCRAYNISVNKYRYRINAGWSLEMALTMPNSEHVYVDHLGNKFNSIKAMCKYHKVPIDYYNKKIKEGYSLKDVLTSRSEKSDRVYIDHLGNKYSSLEDMCKYYDVKVSVYKSRIHSGKTLEEALLGTGMFGGVVVDHKGKEYKNLGAMCIAYGIDNSVYNARKRAGWDLERILTTPIRKKRN